MRALDVWLDFAQHGSPSDGIAFEELCRKHADIAQELRALRAGGALAADLGQLPEKSSQGSLEEDLQRLAEPLPGDLRFRREGVIARGGMGVIHRVHDRRLDRTLALKEMNASARRDSLGAARFYEEAQVTSQLDHPGIVPVHDCGVDGEGRLFFAMKLVQGRDLRAILELVHEGREGWTTTRAVGVLLKVCEAMAYAHSKGVLHRDLKPGNVMVGSFGEVYVMDWGLARVQGRADMHDIRLRPANATASLHTHRREEREETPDSPLVTMDGIVVGTPAYMPPEQARGEIERLAPCSDVYSVGAILYHLLAGETPYVPKGARISKHTVLARVMQGPPPRVSGLAPRAPVELTAICEKAMARKPSERYADMAELGEDLRAYLEGRVVRAHESGPIAELSKWVRRNRGFASACATALLAIVAGSLSSYRQGVRASESASQVKRESERANQEARVAEERAQQVLRLSDMQDLDGLLGDADALWPVLPESTTALVDWLAREQRLRNALPEHEHTLAELEESGSGEDQWWRNQLTKLIQGVRALEDPRTGLVEGLSPEHGWGIERRLALARSLREDSLDGPEAARRWSEATASIRDRSECRRYGGFELDPQLGLLPIGRDRESGLWEFAHLASGAPARRTTDGKLILEEGTGIVLVLVPGGSTWLGAQGEEPNGKNYVPEAGKYEAALREWSTEPFFLSKYEMTQDQWLRFCGSNPSQFFQAALPTPLGPVQQVSAIDCALVARRMGLELPTEPQWEYAARAGTSYIWWTGDEKESLWCAANLSDQSGNRFQGNDGTPFEDWDDGAGGPATVGSYDANPFGLFDVVGNVSEWCLLERISGELASSGLAALRGGSWRDTANWASSSRRSEQPPGFKNGDIGLRPSRRIQSAR